MHVSVYLEAESPCQSPHFKQLILGLWLDFCFTNFLDFNCNGYYDGALSERERAGFHTFCSVLCSLLLEPHINFFASCFLLLAKQQKTLNAP